MGSVRLVRQLCWALVVLAIVTAVFGIGVSMRLFVPFPDVPDAVDFVERLARFRMFDAQMFPFILIGSLASLGLFLVAAALGVALRPFANGSLRDVMAMLFVVGATVGILAQLVNIGVNQIGALGYCDCGYRGDELIAQDKTLQIGWNIQTWLNTASLVILAIGVAVAGRVLTVNSAWRMLSYVIAAGAILAAALQTIAGFTFDGHLFEYSNIVIAVVAGIGVPLWAIVLARSIHNLRIWTTGIGGTAVPVTGEA